MSASRIEQVIDALETERADARKRLEWLEKEIEEFREHHQESEPASPTP